MSLNMTSPGEFSLEGLVTFDNAAVIASEGEAALQRFLRDQPGQRLEVSLSKMEQLDSSALSVFLSWMRFAKNNGTTICFSGVPAQLEALANVCDMKDLIAGMSCQLY